tara:strand:- start:498 stop:1274 length:777 start_codon:yes stop_codon:yes gene_type:complete
MNLLKGYINLSFILLLAPLYSYSAEMPDYKREQNINDQIIDYIIDGDVITLNSKLEKKFNLIVNKFSNISFSVLMLHGRGLHPVEPNVMEPIRSFLIDKNIDVYSLQLPVLSKGKTYDDYYKIFDYSDERISEALKYIHNDKIIIIAHSCGVHMISSWLKKNQKKNIDGLVLIGSGAVDKNQNNKSQINYNKLNMPILNIYGEYDHGSVRENSSIFQQEYLGNKYSLSRDIEILGSDHDHKDNSDPLVEAVKQWLKLL